MGILAVFPATFDPVTNGHLDVIQRAVRLFDRVVVAVAHNPSKTSLFTPEERVDMIRASVKKLKNVSVMHFAGLVVDCARLEGARPAEDLLFVSAEAITHGWELWALPLFEPPMGFRRGDCNDDGRVNISDAAWILNWLFRGGAEPGCAAAASRRRIVASSSWPRPRRRRPRRQPIIDGREVKVAHRAGKVVRVDDVDVDLVLLHLVERGDRRTFGNGLLSMRHADQRQRQQQRRHPVHDSTRPLALYSPQLLEPISGQSLARQAQLLRKQIGQRLPPGTQKGLQAIGSAKGPLATVGATWASLALLPLILPQAPSSQRACCNANPPCGSACNQLITTCLSLTARWG